MAKKLYFILVALALVLSVSAQTPKAPAIRFETTEHDFGKIKTDKPVRKYKFKFKNVGDAKLVITSANAFCDCIKIKYPEKFIAPGDTGVITVTYNSTSPGTFYKDVQIYTNCEQKMVRLYLKGEVVEK